MSFEIELQYFIPSVLKKQCKQNMQRRFSFYDFLSLAVLVSVPSATQSQKEKAIKTANQISS